MLFRIQAPSLSVHQPWAHVCTPIGVSALWVCLLLILATACAKHTAPKTEEPKPVVSVPVQTGKGWAVVIGIQQYEQGVQVKYARADAKAVADVLMEQRFKVTTLYDQQATKAAIDATLEDILVKRAGADDRVVIFFAGKAETINLPEGSKGFFLPVDAGGDVVQTGFPLERVRGLVEASPARHVLVIAAASLGGLDAPPLGSKIEQPEAVTRPGAERGAHIIVAASADHPTIDVPEWNHSLFIHYLLEGLRGAEADVNRDGVVHTAELFAYLESNVVVSSRIRGGVQQPQLRPLSGGGGEMILVPAQGRSAMPEFSPETPGSFAVREMETELRTLEQTLEELEAQKPKGPPKDETGALIIRQIKETQKKADEVRDRYLQARLLAGHDVIGQDGARMALVPAGEFVMGEDTKKYAVGDPAYNYEPTHTVYVDAFYIDKYEVTAGQYAKFLEENKREEPRFWGDMKLERDSQRPVIGISWEDANAYCKWVGRRLPTEAEWEKAARGTDGRKYPWGNEEPKRSLASYDWYGINSWKGYQTLSPVGSFEAGRSPYGVYDMAGNVWEWVADWYNQNYYVTGPKVNPKGPEKGKERVVRGGSWRHPPELLRSAYRHRYQPTVLPFTYLGFRCAQDPPK